MRDINFKYLSDTIVKVVTIFVLSVCWINPIEGLSNDKIVNSDSDTINTTIETFPEINKEKTEQEAPITIDGTNNNLVIEEDIIVEESIIAPAFVGIEETIVNYCLYYGIDYTIVLAIARLETGWFTSYAYLNGNNPGGLSINEVPIIFNTIEEGVEAFVSNLANNYFAIGLNTPEKIGSKYCPINSAWSVEVRKLMNM